MPISPLDVLLVQGRPGDLERIRQLLAGTNGERLEVEHAARSEDGLAALTLKRYDVVLIADGAQPRSGIETLRVAVRRGHPGPFILLAPDDDPDLDVDAMLAGASDCLPWPRLDAAWLRRAIRMAMDRAEVLRSLRESEQRFRTLVEHGADLIALLAADTTILYVSRSVTTILDYPVAGPLGRKILQLVHPDDSAEAARLLARSLRSPGTPVRADLRLQRRDGSPRDVAGTLTNHLDEPSVRAMVLNVHDVTDQKRAEREVQESETRFRLLADNVPVMIWIDDTDMQLIYSNKTHQEFAGRTLEQDRGLGWVDPIHPDDRAQCLATYQQACRARLPLRMEYRMQRYDGAYRWILDIGLPRFQPNGDFVGYAGCCVDVTEIKETGEALRESEGRYRTVLESLQEGIVMQDAMGRVLACNPSAERILGLTAEQLRERPLLHPSWEPVRENGAPFPADQHPASLTLRTGSPISGIPMGIKRPDGTQCWLSMNVQPLFREGESHAYAAVISFADVTDRHRLEEQFRHTRRMETAGRLAGGVAHDFNNLLTAILGTSDLILLDLPEGNPHREDVEEIKRAAQRAANLTRQLLAFSRRQVLQPKVIDLNGVVQNIEKMLRRLIGEDIILVTRLRPGLGRVRADPGQIEQVLMNLSVNARDAMPQGGSLLIETANRDLDTHFTSRHPGVHPGPYVGLTVTDTGIGMSDETQAHLFEPFFTTKEPGKGTGLGLATVYGIVKQSGGYIYAESELGRGSTFNVYLPRVEDAADVVEHSAPAPLTSKASGTLLLVEDDEAVRRLGARVLKAAGYRVLDAPHGGDALQQVQHEGQHIDLLITDVVMPGMSGQELARRLVTIYPELKVLYISGYTHDAIAQHGTLAAGSSFLQKPFTPEVLAERVKDILG